MLDKKQRKKEIIREINNLTDLHCLNCQNEHRHKMIENIDKKTKNHTKIFYCNTECGVGVLLKKLGSELEKQDVLKDRSKKGTEEQSADNYIRLRLKGYDYKEIAHLFGVSGNALTDYRTGHNLYDSFIKEEELQ
jgi:hypothetical protein